MTPRALLAAAIAGAAAATGWPAVVCWWRGQHDPARTRLGLRCLECKAALADYAEAGTMEDGHVTQMRSWRRDNGGEFVRGERWREKA